MSKHELPKLMMVGTELAKENDETKRAWGPKSDKDKDEDRDQMGKGRSKRKGNTVSEVAAEEDTPTSDAP